MTDQKLPPAVTGAEMRLDALIARVDRLCDLLTPVALPKPPEGAVELREPEAPVKRQPSEKRKRR